MFYRYELLNKVNLKHIQDFYNFSDFHDGKRTGSPNKDLKNNVEMQLEHTNAAWKIIWDLFCKHKVTRERLFACSSTVGLFVKYTEGMHYNWHSDAPYMNRTDPGKSRSDFSTTLFLNDPDEYEGGELLLRQGTEIREINYLLVGHLHILLEQSIKSIKLSLVKEEYQYGGLHPAYVI